MHPSDQGFTRDVHVPPLVWSPAPLSRVYFLSLETDNLSSPPITLLYFPHLHYLLRFSAYIMILASGPYVLTESGIWVELAHLSASSNVDRGAITA